MPVGWSSRHVLLPAARNYGAKVARFQWLLFIDSDCIPTKDTIHGYLRACPDAIAFAGIIRSLKSGLCEDFYESEGTLLPRTMELANNRIVPFYIVTANALVLKEALFEAGGFNQMFECAAGEDVDLSRRLWKLGALEIANTSEVFHEFQGGFVGFCERFFRYGRGNYLFGQISKVRMFPKLSAPANRNLGNYFLKVVQITMLAAGYLFESASVNVRPLWRK